MKTTRGENDREGEDDREEGEEDDLTRTCQNCGAESASENHIRTCGKFMCHLCDAKPIGFS